MQPEQPQARRYSLSAAIEIVHVASEVKIRGRATDFNLFGCAFPQGPRSEFELFMKVRYSPRLAGSLTFRTLPALELCSRTSRKITMRCWSDGSLRGGEGSRRNCRFGICRTVTKTRLGWSYSVKSSFVRVKGR